MKVDGNHIEFSSGKRSDEEVLAIAAKYVRDSSDPYYTFDSIGLLALLHEVLRQSGHARP